MPSHANLTTLYTVDGFYYQDGVRVDVSETIDAADDDAAFEAAKNMVEELAGGHGYSFTVRDRRNEVVGTSSTRMP